MRALRCVIAATLTAASSPAWSDAFVMRIQDLPPAGITIEGAQPLAPPDARTLKGRALIAAAYLGKGSSFWSKDKSLSTQCVKYSLTSMINAPTAPGSSSADNWQAINQVATLTDHFRSESFGVSANVTYKIFSLGGSVSSSGINHYTSSSRYIDVDKGVISDSFFIAELPGGAPLQVEPGIPAADFPRVCGQSFVWKVAFGTIIKGTIDFDIATDASNGTNQVSVSAGITGILNGTANTSKAWSELGNISHYSYNVKGGPAKSPNAEEWLPKINDFGTNPADAASNDIIVFFTAPYRPLRGSRNDVPDINLEALGTLSNLQWSVTDAVQQLSDRQKALQNIAHVNQNADSIRDEVIKLAKYIDDLQIVFKKCSEVVADSQVPACKKAAKDVGLPPPVVPITFK